MAKCMEGGEYGEGRKLKMVSLEPFAFGVTMSYRISFTLTSHIPDSSAGYFDEGMVSGMWTYAGGIIAIAGRINLQVITLAFRLIGKGPELGIYIAFHIGAASIHVAMDNDFAILDIN